MTGAICGLIGVYIVLRNMSYIGHGLSHSVFGGAVVSYVMNWNFYLGAGLWGFLSALLINSVAKRKKIGSLQCMHQINIHRPIANSFYLF